MLQPLPIISCILTLLGRHRVQEGDSVHHRQGLHPQVQVLHQEAVLLDARAEGGQG